MRAIFHGFRHTDTYDSPATGRVVVGESVDVAEEVAQYLSETFPGSWTLGALEGARDSTPTPTAAVASSPQVPVRPQEPAPKKRRTRKPKKV